MAMSPRKRAQVSRWIQYGILAVLAVVVALAADWKTLAEDFFDPEIIAGMFPEVITTALKNTILYTACGLHFRPGARPGPGADAALARRPVPVDGDHVHRVLPRAAGAGGVHRPQRRRPDRLPGPGGARRHARHRHAGPGARRRRLHGRDDPRRHPGGAEGPDGGGPVARDVALPGDGLDRDPAGVPDHPAAADQRADPADQGLLAGLPPGLHGVDDRADLVRRRGAQPGEVP